MIDSTMQGPVAGGFIVENLSYRWIFWILALVGGAAAVYGILVLHETYHPVLLARRAKKQSIEDEKAGIVRELQILPSLKEVLGTSLTRPLILLTRSAICFMLSLYQAV